MGRKALIAGVLIALLALAGLAYRAHTVRLAPWAPGTQAYAPAFRDHTSGPEALLNAHDGQAFGSLALDPVLSHPDDWTGSRSEMAYRASRPLLGWLVALTSFGSPHLAAWSLIVWTAIGIGAVATGAFMLGTQWGRKTDWLPLLLLLPGIAGQVLMGGLSDGFACGLALVGVTWWLQGRDREAVVALCAAALFRESALLVAGALLIAADRPRKAKLLVPFAVYAAWVGMVWLRLQALPTNAGEGRLGMPFLGVLAATRSWHWVEVVSAASIVVFAVVAFWRAPSRDVRWLVVLSLLFATMLGPAVWRTWDITRPLLPVTVVGACLLAGRATQPSEPGMKAPGRVLAQR